MTDQTYHARALDNPVRRWLAPPRRVVARLGPQPGDKVLDLGAGVGYFAEELLSRVGPAGHVTLVDINPSGLQHFAGRHGTDARVDLVAAPASSVTAVGTGTQDRVLFHDVLCDIEDKAGAMAETYRMLRPGGVAYVSFHAVRRPSPRFRFRPTLAAWNELRGRQAWKEIGHGGSTLHPWYLLTKPTSG
jgi:ubiquinone/menaquinone biosynthesis C-methylase UbiE